MFVISRNTAFTYRNRPIDTKQIGRELGVRYVLEGSARPRIPEGVEAMIGSLSFLWQRQSRTGCKVDGPKRAIDRAEALALVVLP